jgi:hypothetical protein
MEGGELFGGLGADFLAANEESFSSEFAGFDPLTGEVSGGEANNNNEDAEEALKKELGFVKDNEEAQEAGEDTEEGEQDNDEEIDDELQTPEESPSSPLTSLTSALREEGVLSSLTEEEVAKIKSGGDLIEVIKKQIEQNEYSDLSENQKEYLEAMRAGVPDAAYREAKYTADQFAKIEPEVLEGEDAVDFRRQVLVHDFLSKGFEKEEADKYAARSIDLGEDVEDAKKALARIKVTEASKVSKLTEDAKAAQKANLDKQMQKINELKLKVQATKEVLPNVKLNTATQDKVFELMTKTAGFDRNNNPVNAVVKSMIEDQDYLVKLSYVHLLTDGFKDFKGLTGTIGSSAVNKLEESLKVQDSKIKLGSSKKEGAGASAGLLGAIGNII